MRKHLHYAFFSRILSSLHKIPLVTSDNLEWVFSTYRFFDKILFWDPIWLH